MNLTQFTQHAITQTAFDLLPEGTEIWADANQEQWITNHAGTLILTISKELFCAEDNEWRCAPSQLFILKPINQ